MELGLGGPQGPWPQDYTPAVVNIAYNPIPIGHPTESTLNSPCTDSVGKYVTPRVWDVEDVCPTVLTKNPCQEQCGVNLCRLNRLYASPSGACTTLQGSNHFRGCLGTIFS